MADSPRLTPIIIGAGRGSRLQDRTEHIPKTLVPAMGRPMLEWILEALEQAGFVRKDVVFVCGYQQQEIRKRYPEFTYVSNEDWQNNNILLSLLCAREHMTGGFLCTYSDIIYDGEIVSKLVSNPGDIVIGCDTDWRRRYVNRSQHPETDAEKLRASGSQVLEVSRRIPSEAAAGEFIGVMKLSAAGARSFLEAFDSAERAFSGQTWREGRQFERAYLIDLLQDMLEKSTAVLREDTRGRYMELDTLEDLSHAERWWRHS